MELRDYFAARAIYFLSASGIDSASFIAIKAYEIADAMLAEREKNKPPTSHTKWVALTYSDKYFIDRNRAPC